MEPAHLSLALFFLIFSPVSGQWWSLFWGNPKTTTIPPSVTSPTVTYPRFSETSGTTAVWSVKVDEVPANAVEGVHTEGSALTPTQPSSGVSPSGFTTTDHWTFPTGKTAGGDSKSGSSDKPLKHWRNGEFNGCSNFLEAPLCSIHLGLAIREIRFG